MAFSILLEKIVEKDRDIVLDLLDGIKQFGKVITTNGRQ